MMARNLLLAFCSSFLLCAAFAAIVESKSEVPTSVNAAVLSPNTASGTDLPQGTDMDTLDRATLSPEEESLDSSDAVPEAERHIAREPKEKKGIMRHFRRHCPTKCVRWRRYCSIGCPRRRCSIRIRYRVRRRVKVLVKIRVKVRVPVRTRVRQCRRKCRKIYSVVSCENHCEHVYKTKIVVKYRIKKVYRWRIRLIWKTKYVRGYRCKY